MFLVLFAKIQYFYKTVNILCFFILLSEFQLYNFNSHNHYYLYLL